MKRRLIVELEPDECEQLFEPIGHSQVEIDVEDVDEIMLVTRATPALEGEDRPLERLRFDEEGETYEVP